MGQSPHRSHGRWRAVRWRSMAARRAWSRRFLLKLTLPPAYAYLARQSIAPAPTRLSTRQTVSVRCQRGCSVRSKCLAGGLHGQGSFERIKLSIAHRSKSGPHGSLLGCLGPGQAPSHCAQSRLEAGAGHAPRSRGTLVAA
jgi:hypothetical protein